MKIMLAALLAFACVACSTQPPGAGLSLAVQCGQIPPGQPLPPECVGRPPGK